MFFIVLLAVIFLLFFNLVKKNNNCSFIEINWNAQWKNMIFENYLFLQMNTSYVIKQWIRKFNVLSFVLV